MIYFYYERIILCNISNILNFGVDYSLIAVELLVVSTLFVV